MKKILAMLLTLAMLFALAACGDKVEDTPENTDPVVENTDNAAKPNAPTVYTYEEDRGDFKVTWELTMYPNGIFYLNETHGLSGNVTEHSGNTWMENENGTVTTGPWSNADVDKSDFFQPTGECTWILNDDGTMAPTDFVAPPVGAGSVYTYSENRGDFSVEWSLTLNEDGTYVLDEVHGLSGNLTTHTGSGWTDNGDGTLTTGAWDVDENKSEFFNADGSCTWILGENNTITPASAGEAAETTGIAAGKYTYEEDHGAFVITYDILLMGNGNCRIDETHGMSGEVTEHTASGWTDNGDGTVTTGEWEDSSGDKSDFFKPNGEATWKITGEGTCEPVAEGEGGGAASEINPGKYTYAEDHGAFQITFDVLLMGNGNCRIDETHGMSGNVTEHIASGWTDNGDGTVTTGEWEDSSGDKSDFFKPNGEATWKINADGTCEPVTEEKQETASSVNPGKYTYVDGDTTWEVRVMGNGTSVVTELNTASGEVIKEHTTKGSEAGEGWVDNGDGTFETDEWEPEEREDNKPKFASPNGVTVWKVVDAANSLVEPTEKKEEQSAIAYGAYHYHDTARDEHWSVMIMGNGTCVIQVATEEGKPVIGDNGPIEYKTKGFRVNDDGTFTNFSIEDGYEIPEFLSGGESGMATWKIVDAGNMIVEMVKE